PPAHPLRRPARCEPQRGPRRLRFLGEPADHRRERHLTRALEARGEDPAGARPERTPRRRGDRGGRRQTSGAGVPFGLRAAAGAGTGGYLNPGGEEPYIARSSGQPVTGAGCSFAANAVYILRLTHGAGVTVVDAP